MIKAIMFDFDGVIADSPPVIHEIIRQIAIKEGYDYPEFEELRNTTIHDLLKIYKVPKLKVPGYVKEGNKIFRNMGDKVDSFEGLPKVLRKLSDNFKLIILTSNSTNFVKAFLKRQKIEFFEEIFGGVTFFGKTDKMKKVLKKLNLKPEEVLSVGDERRDIKASKEVGMKTIGVTWGLQTKELLKEENPEYLVTSPEELLKIIQNETS